MFPNNSGENMDNFQEDLSGDLEPFESVEVFADGKNSSKEKYVDMNFSNHLDKNKCVNENRDEYNEKHENEGDIEYGGEIEENVYEDTTTEFDSDIFIDCANMMKQEIKKYVCNICDRDCGRASELKRHLRTHTGDKPFKCDICEKTFALSSNYYVHIRIHTTEKPYKCNVCDKAFAMSYYLKKHMKTHLGKKSYSCMHCGNSFTTPNYLKKHIQNHHCDISEVA